MQCFFEWPEQINKVDDIIISTKKETMARRPEGNGKKKRKSVKAKMTSKFGSKRKLSRMGKRVKEVS